MTESDQVKNPPLPEIKPEENGKKKSHALIWLTLIIIICAIAWGLYWFLYLRFYEFTDDAYANGNFLTINSVIDGPVIAWYADDTDFVNEGDLLVELDSTKYQIIYDKELANLSSIVLQVRQLYNNLQANQAIVENKKTNLERARYDYENRLQLVSSQAISNEDFIHAKDQYLIAQLELKQAEYLYEVSVDAIGDITAKISNHPLIEKQKNQVREAYYNLKHCSIFAPSPGYIAQRSVDVGQWVAPNTPLMALIPTDYVWVDANYKETQLTQMRVGQPATVWFDIYGSNVIYKGKVLGIAMGSGSVFSLIPPQNATGNWIKIVQRLPVRISLDPEVVKKYPIRLGISAEVTVDITDQDLPFLASTPPTEPVATTRVFDIHLDEVNQKIEDIIQENIRK